MGSGIKRDTLASVDIVEIVESGGLILEEFVGVYCHNTENNIYRKFFTDMFEKRNT